MSTKFEIRGLLAKLLATENIIVEHKPVDTASFDVLNRVLTLPLFEKASDDVYTLLILHEISHSNFTPVDDVFSDSEIPNSFINITEDARVEKLCKRKYAGSPKYFYKGYKELYDLDFFEIKDQDISDFNLADRVNLYFKVGNFINIPFTSKEQEIVNLIADAETFDDAVNAAKVLYKYCKEEENLSATQSFDNVTVTYTSISEGSEDGQSMTSQGMPVESSNTSENSEPTQNNGLSQNQDGDSTQKQPVKGSNPSSIDSQKSEEEPKTKTVESLEKNIQKLTNPTGYETSYVEIPKLNLDTVIAKNSDVHNELRSHYATYNESAFTTPDSKFYKFKKSAQKEVNYLIKEFECRKAADSYARVTTAKTGSLDASKIYSYKFNDDLFKKVSVVPDGKNHGLIFILDWSGSMEHVLLDTCKQLYNLIWFCRKMSIPFDVYAFTGEWRRPLYDMNSGYSYGTAHYDKKPGVFYVDDSFSLMNILTSQVPTRVLDEQMLNIWRIAYYCKHKVDYNIPNRLMLSGTPLNESLIALHEIIPHFHQKTKVQKVHCVVLTDGEANSLPYHVTVPRKKYDGEIYDYLGTRHVIPGRTFLRDRKLGTTYKFDGEYGSYYKVTEVFLRNLKDKFPEVNFIGFRLLASREAHRFISSFYSNDEYTKKMEEWRINKSFSILNSGYHTYFGMQAKSVSDFDEFEVDEDSSLSKIKNAFSKSLKTKKFNKKILGDFVSIIA